MKESRWKGKRDLRSQEGSFSGGATQNSIRTAQWILGGGRDEGKNQTAYFGCVGKDEAAEILKKRAHQDGVDVR